jgi:hypothetical protein
MKRVLLLCLIGMAAANAQSQQSTKNSGTYHASIDPMDMINMPSVGPLFLETQTFSTTVSVVNAGTSPVTGMLVLRALDGTTIIRKPVTVGGHSSVSLKVSDVLTSVGSQVQQGRVELYDDSVAGSALVGQLTLSYADRARVHILDEELTMPSMTTSQVLRGVAVDSTSAPFVAVTNPGMQPEDVSANCYPENAGSEELHFTIQPEGTALLHGCRLLKGELDADWLSKSPASPIKGTTYAMELAAVTPNREIEAFGLAPNTVNGRSEWTSVYFFDPAKLTSPTTIFAGIPVGNTPLLWGTYTPRLAIHNFGLQSQDVDVRLATTRSGFARTETLKTLTLQPNESRSLDVAETAVSNELLNTLTVEGSDPGGNIVAQLLLEDGSQDLRTQLIGKSGADDTNIGMHPWNLSSGEDDELLLYNQTDSAQHAYLRIGNGQSVWEKTVTLGSWATQRIKLNGLIATHAKDDHGKELVLGDGYGEVSWSADAPRLLKGRLLRLNNTTHTTTSFQCSAYQVICNGWIIGPTSMVVGQQGSWGAYASACINGVASNYCSGAPSGSISPSGYQWTVSGIQTSGALSSSSVSGTATGTTGGTAALNVNMTDYFSGCVVPASSSVAITTVTGISPSTWIAGQSYTGATGTPVQITGTNFDSTSTVILSDHNIGVSLPYNTSTTNGISTTYVDVSVPPSTSSELVTVTVVPGSVGSSFLAPGGSPPSGSNTATVLGVQQALQQASCPAMLDANSGFSAIAPTGLAGSGTMTVSFSQGSYNGYGVTVHYGPYSTRESIASHLAALITKNYHSFGLFAQSFGSYIEYKSNAPLGTASLTSSGSSFAADPSPNSCPPVSINLRLVPVVSRDESQSSGTTMLHNVWRLVMLNHGIASIPSGGHYTVFEHLPINIGNALVSDGQGGFQSPAPGAEVEPNMFDDGIGCRTMNVPILAPNNCILHPPYGQKFTITGLKDSGVNSGVTQSVMTRVPGQGDRLVMTIHEHFYSAGRMNNDSGPMPQFSPDPYPQQGVYPNY